MTRKKAATTAVVATPETVKPAVVTVASGVIPTPAPEPVVHVFEWYDDIVVPVNGAVVVHHYDAAEFIESTTEYQQGVKTLEALEKALPFVTDELDKTDLNDLREHLRGEILRWESDYPDEVLDKT